MPARAAVGVVISGVRSDVADVEPVGLGVDREAPRIAESHRENFGFGFLGARGEEVSFRDGVGGVGVDLESKNFTPKILGVCRGFLGVEGGSVFAFVDG